MAQSFSITFVVYINFKDLQANMDSYINAESYAIEKSYPCWKLIHVYILNINQYKNFNASVMVVTLTHELEILATKSQIVV